MKKAQSYIEQKLAQRRAAQAFRQLSTENGLIDFSSNDYLGFARLLPRLIVHSEDGGATGSRLLTGNSAFCESLETTLAQQFGAAAALIFNSGYDANLGLISALAQRGDTIIYDQLSHASIRDGLALSNAKTWAFAHNDLGDLEEKLSRASGIKYIITESVFSMDGDVAPLKAIAHLATKYDAALIVDEAHGVGVYGDCGEGLCILEQIDNQLFAKIITFGKAFGGHGAVVLGNQELRDYLINFARPFIYSTALPKHSLSVIQAGVKLLANQHESLAQLRSNIAHFTKGLGEKLKPYWIESDSAIHTIIIPDNAKVKATAGLIQQAGYDVRAILHPTVPKGKERLRICLHAFNTKSEIDGLLDILNKILN